MAGRPRAPTTIVDPNTIVRMRQRDDKYNMLSLLPEIADTDASVSWLPQGHCFRRTSMNSSSATSSGMATCSADSWLLLLTIIPSDTH